MAERVSKIAAENERVRKAKEEERDRKEKERRKNDELAIKLKQLANERKAEQERKAGAERKGTFLDELMGMGRHAAKDIRENQGNLLKGKEKIDESVKGGEHGILTEEQMSEPDLMKANLLDKNIGTEMDEKIELEMSEKFINLINIKGKDIVLCHAMMGRFIKKSANYFVYAN
jgi:hypothetical protein